MTEQQTQEPLPQKKEWPEVVQRAASMWGIDADRVFGFMKATIVRGTNRYQPTNEDCGHVLLVAMQHKLNPFAKEIHAFVDRDRIIPVVGVDGWARIANANGLDGVEYEYGGDTERDGKACPEWVEAIVYVKGRERPVRIREYLDECYVPQRGSYPGPWQSHPRRMLRHKAFIQACRVAFSIGGIYDEDEAQRVAVSSNEDTTKRQITGEPVDNDEDLNTVDGDVI